MVIRLNSSWVSALLIFSLHILVTSLYSPQVTCSFFHRRKILFFSQHLLKSLLFIHSGLLPLQLILRFLRTA